MTMTLVTMSSGDHAEFWLRQSYRVVVSQRDDDKCVKHGQCKFGVLNITRLRAKPVTYVPMFPP